MKTVTVTVEGGIVQYVDVPEDVEVIVYDYDTDGSDTDVETDDDGNQRRKIVWLPGGING